MPTHAWRIGRKSAPDPAGVNRTGSSPRGGAAGLPRLSREALDAAVTSALAASEAAAARGLARWLGADPDEVARPTFVLLTAYPGRLTLHHADLYRLRGDGDERELGLEEPPGPGGARGPCTSARTWST